MRPKIKTNHSFLERNKKSFSGSFKNSKKGDNFNIFWLILIFISILIVSLIFLIFSKFFNIKNININGLFKTDQNEVENLVLEQKDIKKLIFKQKNLLFFNKNNLIKSLEHYNFKNIEIEKKFFKKNLNIKIEERFQSFLFLEDNVYFSLDLNGYIIESIYNCAYLIDLENKINLIDNNKNNKASSSIEENIIISKDDDIYNKDKQIISENINNCLIIDEEYKKNNLYPIIENIGTNKINNSIKSVKINQEYLDFVLKLYNDIDISGDFGFKNVILDEEYNTAKVKLNNDLEVYFSFKNDYSDQISRFFVLKKELGENLAGKKYIDLRYGDKIYYY